MGETTLKGDATHDLDIGAGKKSLVQGIAYKGDQTSLWITESASSNADSMWLIVATQWRIKKPTARLQRI
jgi:hypothetical protein